MGDSEPRAEPSSHILRDSLPPAVFLWSPPPSDYSLGDDEIHVWCAALDESAECCQRLTHLLSEDERDRAQKFYFEQHRNRFTVGRALLRMILSRYLGTDPRELSFCYAERGKPALAGVAAAESLEFNLAHTGDVALYAVTRGRALGIDIEAIRPMRDLQSIAERFFSPAEAGRLLALPSARHEEAFFNCWTRKEAFLKATGAGITEALDKFEVSLAPGDRAALLCCRIDFIDANQWAMHDLRPASGYVGALAVPERDLRVQCWKWPPDETEAPPPVS